MSKDCYEILNWLGIWWHCRSFFKQYITSRVRSGYWCLIIYSLALLAFYYANILRRNWTTFSWEKQIAKYPAQLIERSVIEPNRTQSLDWVRLGSVIELNRTHKNILPIERNRTFGNRTVQQSNMIEHHNNQNPNQFHPVWKKALRSNQLNNKDFKWWNRELTLKCKFKC